MTHLDRAVLHRVEHLQAGHDLARGEHADVEPVVGHLADVLEKISPRRRSCRATSESSMPCAISARAGIWRWPEQQAYSQTQLLRRQARRYAKICGVAWWCPPRLSLLCRMRFHPAEFSVPWSGGLGKGAKEKPCRSGDFEVFRTANLHVGLVIYERTWGSAVRMRSQLVGGRLKGPVYGIAQCGRKARPPAATSA